MRKLTGILNAIEVQIETGGDSPEVNGLLLDALRAAVRHEASVSAASEVLQAIEQFAQAEARRWEQVVAGTLPPIELTPDKRLDELLQAGYELMQANQRTAACDRWLEAWELVKQMARPELRTADAFDRAHPGLQQFVSNWCSDLEMELGNASLDTPIYHEHRIRYAREFLAEFPDEEANSYVNFMRAQGEVRLLKKSRRHVGNKGRDDRTCEQASFPPPAPGRHHALVWAFIPLSGRPRRSGPALALAPAAASPFA
jgi:hypothetical protein